MLVIVTRPSGRPLTSAPITSESALRQAQERLAVAPRVALDTEFMRERTYFADLALLQMADPSGVILIDPVAGLSPDLLATVLRVPGQTKVLHAARQDVEVLLPLTEAPLQPLLDTQVAAALLGFPPQIGYGDLVSRELGITLEKTQSRTDWLRRPLSPAQLDYAADDVRWLLPLAAQLESRLEDLGRSAWLEEDMHSLTDPTLYRVDPVTAWTRLKGIETLPPREQLRVRCLAAWRERRAIRRNLPRGWVLADDALRAIARAAPETAAQLARLEVMPPGAAEKMGADILETLNDAANQSPDGIVQRQDSRPTPEERALTQRLAERTRARAEELGLAPEVLATQRDFRRLTRGEAVDQVLSGWRLRELGDRLAADAPSVVSKA